MTKLKHAISQSPSVAEVARFVRSFTGHGNHVAVSVDTRLEADLGVTGDDGSALLEEASRYFNAALAGPDGYRSTFRLRPNEYLFHSEGLDLVGLGALLGGCSGVPGQSSVI